MRNCRTSSLVLMSLPSIVDLRRRWACRDAESCGRPWSCRSRTRRPGRASRRCLMEKDTSSTAFKGLERRKPMLISKYSLRPLTSIRGRLAMASDMRFASFQRGRARVQRRFDVHPAGRRDGRSLMTMRSGRSLQTDLQRRLAAGGERTALGHVQQIDRRAGDRLEPLVPLLAAVGMERIRPLVYS